MFSPLILFLIILVCVLLLLGGHGIYMYQPPPVGWYPPKNIFSPTLVLSSVFFSPFAFSLGRAELALYTTFCNDPSPPVLCFLLDMDLLIHTYTFVCVVLCRALVIFFFFFY